MYDLYNRWQDERGYESWDDYVTAMQNLTNWNIVATTKRPLSFTIEGEDKKKYKVILKLLKMTYQIRVESLN